MFKVESNILKKVLLIITLLIFSNGCKDNTTDPGQIPTVKIGSQVWMLKNLNTDHYRNGDSIPEVRDSATWVNLTTGAWCYYNDDPALGAIYGKLYNWYAVNDPRGLAPVGWHIPSDDEWKVLEITIGMNEKYVNLEGWRGTDEGSKLKETGIQHWLNQIIPATNSSGYTALPGGRRKSALEVSDITSFNAIGYDGYWWTSTNLNSTRAWIRFLSSSYEQIRRDYTYKTSGLSVRCIKD